MRRQLAGSVTFFYACIALMLVSVLGTVLESVRVHTARSMISDSAYLAMQNSLAGYQRELWEDYHLFFLDMTQVGGVEGMTQELQENLDLSWTTDTLLSKGDWMGVICKPENVTVSRGMTDSEGEELKKQIMAYMRYRAVTGTAEMLLGQFDMVKGLKQSESLLERKLQLERSASQAEEDRLQAMQQLEDMESVWQRTDAVLDSIQEKERIWMEQEAAKQAEREAEQESGEVAEELIETEDAPAGPDILAELDELYRIAGNLTGQNKDVDAKCVSYKTKYQVAEKQREEYRNWLAEQKDSLEENAWDALQKDLTELEATQQKDAAYMSGLQGDLARNQVVLQNLRAVCMQGMENADQISSGQLSQIIGGYQKQLLPTEYELPVEGGSGENPFARLKEYASKGVLALVLPEGYKVSQNVLEPAGWQVESDQISENTDEEKGKQGQLPVAEEAGDLLLGAEYIREHFGCYGEERENTAFQYEREYLLIGSHSDQENLAGTVSELLLLRTVADFLQMITKPDKVAEAQRLATAIAGVTGSSALIPVLKTGILLLWSVEDAVSEVRELMAGGEVAVYSDLGTLALDYQEYLSLLLMLGQRDRYLRVARLIEGNVQLCYWKDFQATDCIASLQMTVNAEIAAKFFGSRRWQMIEEYQLGYNS